MPGEVQDHSMDPNSAKEVLEPSYRPYSFLLFYSPKPFLIVYRTANPFTPIVATSLLEPLQEPACC